MAHLGKIKHKPGPFTVTIFVFNIVLYGIFKIHVRN